MDVSRSDIRSIKSNGGKQFLPRLGSIRLGIKKQNKDGIDYPVEVDYFVVPPEVEAIYGKNPKELHIFFPSEDIEKTAPRAYKWHGAKELKCKGNGEIALCFRSQLTKNHVLFDGESREGSKHEQVKVKCTCPLYDSGDCIIKMDLMVMLPRVSLGGVYQITTGSSNIIRRVDQYFDYLNEYFGRASRLPIKLTREEQEVTYVNDKDERVKSKHWPLKFELIADMKEAQQFLEDDKKMLSSRLLVAAPVEEGYTSEIESVKDLEDSPPPEAEDAGYEEGESGNNSNGKTKNFEFLKSMGSLKKELNDLTGNDEKYYAILKQFKVKKSNEITDRKIQGKVYRAIKGKVESLPF